MLVASYYWPQTIFFQKLIIDPKFSNSKISIQTSRFKVSKQLHKIFLAQIWMFEFGCLNFECSNLNAINRKLVRGVCIVMFAEIWKVEEFHHSTFSSQFIEWKILKLFVNQRVSGHWNWIDSGRIILISSRSRPLTDDFKEVQILRF